MSELERELRALGGAIAYPSTPDLGATVSHALTSRRRWPWRAWATVAVALVALAIGVTLAVPPARTAVFRFFHIGAVHVRFVDRLPQVEEQKVVPPGERVSANQSPFPLLRSPLLGPPDAVYTDGATLTQVFGKPGAARLFIMQIPHAGLSPEIVKKVATVSGTRTSFVTVCGRERARALDRGGTAHRALPRLARPPRGKHARLGPRRRHGARRGEPEPRAGRADRELASLTEPVARSRCSSDIDERS